LYNAHIKYYITLRSDQRASPPRASLGMKMRNIWRSFIYQKGVVGKFYKLQPASDNSDA
jgi:hypothetical protein